MFLDTLAEFEITEPWQPQGPADEATIVESSIIASTSARKIPNAEWLLYKEEIEVLFLKANKTLADVMVIMEKTHGFEAKFAPPHNLLDNFTNRATGRLNTYGNSSSGASRRTQRMKIGNSLHGKLQKRDLEEKESDIYIN
jgi:hypothetical protein